jgi:hypothetical protein
MFNKIKEFFTGKPAVVETPAEAPYKVEVEAKVEAVIAQPVAEVAPVVAEVAPTVTAKPKKAPAKKQQFDKKPATKKPRGPRKPKVAK